MGFLTNQGMMGVTRLALRGSLYLPASSKGVSVDSRLISVHTPHAVVQILAAGAYLPSLMISGSVLVLGGHQ